VQTLVVDDGIMCYRT